MSIVQALTPKVSQIDNNLMPPPPTMPENTAEDNANKNLKFKGLYCRIAFTDVHIFC